MYIYMYIYINHSQTFGYMLSDVDDNLCWEFLALLRHPTLIPVFGGAGYLADRHMGRFKFNKFSSKKGCLLNMIWYIIRIIDED